MCGSFQRFLLFQLKAKYIMNKRKWIKICLVEIYGLKSKNSLYNIWAFGICSTVFLQQQGPLPLPVQSKQGPLPSLYKVNKVPLHPCTLYRVNKVPSPSLYSVQQGPLPLPVECATRSSPPPCRVYNKVPLYTR